MIDIDENRLVCSNIIKLEDIFWRDIVHNVISNITLEVKKLESNQ